MRRAVDALLGTARLEPEQELAADELERALSEAVDTRATRAGLDARVPVTDRDVVAEVCYRARRAGWFTQWSPVFGSALLAGGSRDVVGHVIMLVPSDAACEEAERLRAMSAIPDFKPH